MNKMAEILQDESGFIDLTEDTHLKDEFAVDKDKVELISSEKKNIESLFQVQIIIDVEIDEGATGIPMVQKRWVEVQGNPWNRQAAKEFIKSLCNPQETHKMKYPRVLHELLVTQAKGKIEYQSRAVLSFNKEEAQVEINGSDSVVTTLALSALEDFITQHTGEIFWDPEHGFSQDASRRLDQELRRLSSEEGYMVSETDLSSMNNDAIKRAMLDTITSSENEKNEFIDIRKSQAAGRPVVDEGTSLGEAARHLKQIRLVPPVLMPEVGINGGGQSLGSSETAGNSHDAPSLIPSSVKFLREFARSQGFTDKEIDEVFDCHGHDMRRIEILKRLNALRESKTSTGAAVPLSSGPSAPQKHGFPDGSSPQPPQSKRQNKEASEAATRWTASASSSSTTASGGSGSGSGSAPSRDDADPLENYMLRRSQHDTTVEGIQNIDELKKNNAERQRLLMEAREAATRWTASASSSSASASEASTTASAGSGSGSGSAPRRDDADPLKNYMLRRSQHDTTEEGIQNIDELKKNNVERQRLLMKHFEGKKASRDQDQGEAEEVSDDEDDDDNDDADDVVVISAEEVPMDVDGGGAGNQQNSSSPVRRGKGTQAKGKKNRLAISFNDKQQHKKSHQQQNARGRALPHHQQQQHHNSGQQQETQHRSRSPVKQLIPASNNLTWQQQEQQRHHRSPSPTRLGFNSSRQRKAGDNSTGSSSDNNLRYIVIDGSNVAMAHGNHQAYSCRGIEICVEYFLRRGHKQITAFVPQLRSRSAGPDNNIKDQHLLEELRKRGHLVFTPARRVPGRTFVAYDDRFVIRLAEETEGIIISNDNYRDLWQEKQEWRAIIENRLLMFSFVGDLFMPPEDPLGRMGPHLDDFLRVTPLANNRQQQPFPLLGARMPPQQMTAWRTHPPPPHQQQRQPYQARHRGFQPGTGPSNAAAPRQQQQQQHRGASSGGGGGFQRDQQRQPQPLMPQPLLEADGDGWQEVPTHRPPHASSHYQNQSAAHQRNRTTSDGVADFALEITQPFHNLQAQLYQVFPGHESQVDQVLCDHPRETDLNKLSAYVLNYVDSD